MTPMRRFGVAMGLGGALALSACAPLVVAGAGAVVADAVVEESQGGDGLF